MSGPLTGYKIIELAGIGPGPYAGQLLADMGAEVINVERATAGAFSTNGIPSIDKRNKKSIVVDIRKAEGVQVILKLIESADALIEGLRPGVTERLGVGPDDCHKINPKLVYGRMTGWGQTGPLSKTAGHDINYISITGALAAMGPEGTLPTPPLNLLGDYGGGSLFLVNGILAALLQVKKTGKGEVIDTAICDGTSSLMSIIYSLHGINMWRPQRGTNLLDGSMPFYRCYQTADHKFISVGCLEPQFFAEMLSLLNIDPADFGQQMDSKAWAMQHTKLEDIFATKTRDTWADLFDGTDACVTPVLDYLEATHHPHNIARGGLKHIDQFIHPKPTPDFASHDTETPKDISPIGRDTREVLTGIGYTDDEVTNLETAEVVKSSPNTTGSPE